MTIPRSDDQDLVVDFSSVALLCGKTLYSKMAKRGHGYKMKLAYLCMYLYSIHRFIMPIAYTTYYRRLLQMLGRTTPTTFWRRARFHIFSCSFSRILAWNERDREGGKKCIFEARFWQGSKKMHQPPPPPSSGWEDGHQCTHWCAEIWWRRFFWKEQLMTPWQLYHVIQ